MMKTILLVTLSLIFSLGTQALTLKIGVLAPEGTNWAKTMKKMAKEVKKVTNKKVKLKFYFGGSQGDEYDVLRKIRAGALHGGVFTGKTLGDIHGDIRVMELPFTFMGDRKRAWNSLTQLKPYFNGKLASAKFYNLGFFEIGSVYFVSKKKTPNIESLKGLKIWSWEGDKIVSTMVEQMKLVSVPLALPDVLSSLSTGIIEAAYAPPMGIVAFQWNTKIKYLVDFPLAYSVGAFLLSSKSWKKIPSQYQKIINELSVKYLDQVNQANRQDNKEALASLKKSGVEFIKFPPGDEAKGKGIRKGIVQKLEGKLFAKEALKRLNKTL